MKKVAPSRKGFQKEITESDRSLLRVPDAAPSLRLLYTGGRILPEAPAFALPVGRTKIGRDTDERAGIPLPHSRRASREHALCEVRPSEGGLEVQIYDLGSKNGTLVNGVQCSSALLADGDLVRVGDSLLLLRWELARQPDAQIASLQGISGPMRTLRKQIVEFAGVPAAVLILGESGTGKELVAHALHSLSRAAGPFVPINCSAIPESLAESQLFGHMPGSFTGAAARHDGVFRTANGGTLFLDEIGELALSVQPKLLRVLEDQLVSAVGSSRTTRVDVRIVAATNRNLQAGATAGQFRSDLYARLCGLLIKMPPLRARSEDVLVLLATALGPDHPPLTPALAEALVLHKWPLNVRELMQLAVQLKHCAADNVELDLPLVANRLQQAAPAASAAEVRSPPSSTPDGDDNSGSSESEEALPLKPLPREEVERLLQVHRGIVERVAAAAGRSPRQLRRWIEKYGIDLKRWRS